jgi:hypothetical protein
MRTTTPRPIAESELAVVRMILERVPFKAIPRSTIEAVPELVVVGDCECGCACLDFAEPENFQAAGVPVAGGYGSTASGATVETLVFGTPDAILALRILPLGHDDGTLPRLDSIGVMLPGDAGQQRVAADGTCAPPLNTRSLAGLLDA